MGLSDPEERSLIERARGDAQAFGVLYQRYVDRIYNYVFYRVGDAREAEDLTARVFYRALAHIDDYRQRGAPFVAWLYRIAHNLVANWHRDRSRRRDVRLDDYIMIAEKSDGPDHLAERDEETRTLLNAVRQLPDERQQLLILKFVEGYSNAEIGRIMGRSEGAVKSLYHRTLIALKNDLSNQI
jgi:RNA polymerase sigma-70 factor (ECF subfamily)